MAIIHSHKALSGPKTAGDYREQDLLLQLKDGLHIWLLGQGEFFNNHSVPP
jgi:hypothetical protein